MAKRKGGAAATAEYETVDGQQVRKRRAPVPVWMGKLTPGEQEAAQRLLAAGWRYDTTGESWNHPNGLVGLSMGSALEELDKRVKKGGIGITGQGQVDEVTDDLVRSNGETRDGEVAAPEQDALAEDQMHQDLEAAGWTCDHGAWKSPKGRIFTNIKEAHEFMSKGQAPTAVSAADDAPVDPGDREDGDATKATDQTLAQEQAKHDREQAARTEMAREANAIQARAEVYNVWLGSPLTAQLRDWMKEEIRKRRHLAESRALKPKARDEAVIELSVLKEAMAEMHRPAIEARALRARMKEMPLFNAGAPEVEVDMDVDYSYLPDEPSDEDEDDGDDE